MTPAAADWVLANVLVPSAVSCGPQAGGPCPCSAQRSCGACLAGSHDHCPGDLADRETGVYGPGLAWPPRARVHTTGYECRAKCACRTCHTPHQLGLFG